MELEREFLEMTKVRASDTDKLAAGDLEANKRLNLEREMWEGERTDLMRKLKELNRKIEEQTDDLRLIEEQNLELKSDKNRIQLQLEEMRSAYRNKLTKYMEQNGPNSSGLTWQAKEELIRSYTEKEQDLQQANDRKDKLIDDFRQKLRGLKRYARQLKYLAEDWAPLGAALPEVLTMPPPVSLDDEEDDEYLRRQQSEITRLQSKNRSLEETARMNPPRGPGADYGMQTSQVRGADYG
jgi:hypothetical protein